MMTPWVNWLDVYKPKQYSGFDNHDLCLTNLALLGKWSWRSLSSDTHLCRDIILSGNGIHVVSSIGLNLLLLGGKGCPFFSLSLVINLII